MKSLEESSPADDFLKFNDDMGFEVRPGKLGNLERIPQRLELIEASNLELYPVKNSIVIFSDLEAQSGNNPEIRTLFEAIINTLSKTNIEDSASKIEIILENLDNFENLMANNEVSIGKDTKDKESILARLRIIRKLLNLELKSL